MGFTSVMTTVPGTIYWLIASVKFVLASGVVPTDTSSTFTVTV